MIKRLSHNISLAVSALILSLFVLVALIGPFIAPHDPDRRFTEIIDYEGEQYIPSVRPVPPLTLPQFPLGTDVVGRDILSRLLWAIRPTLLAGVGVVLARVGLGILFGILAGWHSGRWPARLLDALSSSLIAIPQIIIAIALIGLSAERPLWLFVVVLGFIGWPDTAKFYQTETIRLRQVGFVESAQALGLSPTQIILRHILPQFWATLPTLITYELSAVLLIMAELGFLGLFIGNGLIIYTADADTSGVSATGLTASNPELGQMLSDFTRKMFQAPWEMVIAATAIFLQVFSLNLFGDGLRRYLRIR